MIIYHNEFASRKSYVGFTKKIPPNYTFIYIGVAVPKALLAKGRYSDIKPFFLTKSDLTKNVIWSENCFGAI